ncbi:ferric reductase like transmembrane component-domain-containing protein [Macrophomina phaseolina]|uniref:ferric-chelate reductase (NADPH) n=1 Tax=Macrophomina phaseolina TaxID=35725 RepID=A0ABQ8FV73_9PEZI|nr:ferric reductase like transmembrane component-domain-containing protein [Macrophomina phaseolina]
MAPNRWPNDPLPSGVPYSDLPITNSNCMNKSCIAFAAGWNESEKVAPLMTQINYSYWALCYYMSWLVIFTAAHLIHVITDHFTRPRTANATAKPRWTHKVAARYRSIAYRRFSGRWAKLGMPSLGLFALFALTTIFFTCLIFPERPYLRSRFRFGSPLCLSALMPLLIALGGKVNIITWLTGASYAELNIFHRFVGGVVFALATIHTVPHIVAPIKDGGYDYFAQLFIWKRRELSGVILYFIFLVMMVLSLPAVRRRFYEFFAFTHIILGTSFFGVLWWHIKGEFASPIYIYTTVGIFIFSNLLRIVHRNRSFLRGNPLCKCGWKGPLGGFPTKIEQLPGKITKLTVDVPATMRWAPGRHSYVRMPRISVFGNHPFTIASIPSASSHEPNQLVFLIRAHAGFTRALADRAALHQAPVPHSSTAASSASNVQLLPPGGGGEKPTKTDSAPASLADLEAQRPSVRYSPIRTLVDGTYGTYTGPLHRTFDTVVLVAAGTGITAALPYALDLAMRMRDAALLPPASSTLGSPHCAARDVRLVWTVRSESWLAWVRAELDRCVAAANEGAARARAAWGDPALAPGRVVVDVYVTGKRETPAPSAAASQQDMYMPPAPPVPAPALPPPFFRETRAVRAGRERARWSSAETIRVSMSSPPPPPPSPPRVSDCSSAYGLANNALPPSSSWAWMPAAAGAGGVGGGLPCQCCREHSSSSLWSRRSCHNRSFSGSGWADDIKTRAAAVVESQLNVRYERPAMRELVPQLVASPKGGRRAFVMACGPEGLKIELGNVVAGLQRRVMEGEMEKVVLHMETFGW